MSTAVIITMYAVISVELVIAITKLMKIHRMIKQLNKEIHDFQETNDEAFQSIHRSNKTQNEINMLVEQNLQAYWDALRIIVNQIKDGR